MSIRNINLDDLMNSLNTERLILPEIQRDFVWTKKKIVDLVDSLYRDFPIGSFLIWKTLTKVEKIPKNVNTVVQKLGGGELIAGYLLDGQQRLTALLKILNEEIAIRFHLLDGVFEIEKQKNIKNPLYISLSEALKGKIQLLDLLYDLKNKEYINGEVVTKVTENFLKVIQLLKKPVAVLEYPSDDYANATSLFIRFNSGGLKLKQADLAIAELARTAPSLVGNEMRNFSVKWSNKRFAFTIPFLARCLAVIRTGSVKFSKPTEIWIGTKNELKSDWKKTRKAIEKTITFISGTMHWDTTSWLKSHNALIPLVYIMAKNKGQNQLSEYDRKILGKWIAVVTIRGRYSGATETKLDSDIRKLKKRYSPTQLWKTLNKNDKKKITLSEIEDAPRSGPLMSIYYSMIKQNCAKDWGGNGVRIDGTILGHNASLEVHHIFPKSVLYKDGWGVDWINMFPNYALIQKGSNIAIGNKLPKKYLGMGDEFKIQCIPTEKNLWELESYEDFIKERTRLLQSSINKYLGL